MTKRELGQSLIESIVALTILVIGILGAVSLGIYTVRGAEASQVDIIAMNLAQEGIEGVRWIRDANWKIGQAWTTGLVSTENVLPGRIEVNSPEDAEPYTFREWPEEGELPDFGILCFDDGTGLYSHPPVDQTCDDIGLSDSGIKRVVGVWKPGAADEPMTVTVFVYTPGRESYTHTLSEELYDWFAE